jgi:hypothetical protein
MEMKNIDRLSPKRMTYYPIPQEVAGNRATRQQIWEYKEILTAGFTQTNNFIRSEKRVAQKN